MIFTDAITKVADQCRVNPSMSGVSARLGRHINLASAEIWNGFRWSFRWRNYRIVTDVDVTAGSLTATNGSYTVTAQGASPFLSAHVGWHINFSADNIANWYKVRKVTSSTQIELDVPYQGVTGSGKAYLLRHFDYLLPTEPWDIGTVIVTNDRRPLTLLEPTSIDIVGPVPFYKGYPLAAAIYSSDSMAPGGPTTYSTGTVSASNNVVTGSGTSWLANVFPGDQIAINTDTDTYHTIASVDSDTQLTVYQKISFSIGAGNTYKITRQFGRYLRIMWPSTDNYTLDIRALKIYQYLQNGNDSNEFLYRMPSAVVLKAAAIEEKSKGGSNWQSWEDQAEKIIQKCRAEDDSLTPRDSVTGIYSYRQDRRRQYRESYR